MTEKYCNKLIVYQNSVNLIFVFGSSGQNVFVCFWWIFPPRASNMTLIKLVGLNPPRMRNGVCLMSYNVAQSIVLTYQLCKIKHTLQYFTNVTSIRQACTPVNVTDK